MTKPLVSFAPQANQAMKSVSVSAIPSATATKAMAARGENPKRRPWKNSFTGSPMLAARRTLRLGGHSAARLPVVSAATLAERRTSREIACRDDEPPRERDLARPEVREESCDGATSRMKHPRT